MSHSTTCEVDRDAHDHGPAGVHAIVVESGAPTVLAPAAKTVAARAIRVASFFALPEIRWAGMSLLLFLLALLARVAGAPTGVEGVLFAACFAAGGWEPALVGLRAFRGKTLDVDILMIVAALAAAGIGQALDGALLIVIFSSSGALEAVAKKHTEDSVRSLLTLAPEHATRLLPGGSEETVDAATLAVGDLVLIRPGERVGADGRVVNGFSEVDQASITGESLPVAKLAGDEVFAGALNGSGVLFVRVERAAGDTVVARIVTMVEEASATKARTQLFIEKVEQSYSVGVIAATLALFVVPMAFGAPLQTTLLRAMTFMIVASPCAVVLATMPPLLSAIANAGRHGVLVKSAVVMEQLGHTDVVAFDKTGTLTEGTPRVAELYLVPGAEINENDLMALAAAAERSSEHPLARAVVSAAHDRHLSIPDASDFESEPGKGVAATVHGFRVEVGSPVVLGPAASCDPGTDAVVRRWQNAGRTAVVITVDGAPLGVLGLADRTRPGAAPAVKELTEMLGRAPVLLTGDNSGAAGRLAEELRILEVRSDLLPQDKVAAVEELQANGEHVTVVGDGVNDAPALAVAAIGVAMGRQGSDLALQTADVVIARDDLGTLPAVIDLSRRVQRVVRQNLVLAGVVIAALVAVDLTGHLPLPLGVAGHEGSTVLVGLNGLRLLSSRSWRVHRPSATRGQSDRWARVEGARDGSGVCACRPVPTSRIHFAIGPGAGCAGPFRPGRLLAPAPPEVARNGGAALVVADLVRSAGLVREDVRRLVAVELVVFHDVVS